MPAFVVGKVCLVVCLFGISCRTFKSDSTLAGNVKQITREEVRLSIEGPQTLTPEGDGIFRIEIENLRMESIKLYPALNFVAKLRGASGLVPPKMQQGKIAVLGTENPPESTAEAAAFHTTVGKQLIVIKPAKTYQLEVDLKEYFRLDRGNYRFEATVDVVFLSPEDDPRFQRGVRLKPESLEFSVER